MMGPLGIKGISLFHLLRINPLNRSAPWQAELKEQLADLGLPKTGTKSELIDLILEVIL